MGSKKAHIFNVESIDHFLQDFLESKGFQNFITFLIIFNSLLIGVETFPVVMKDYGLLIDSIDLMILALFTIEITLKILVYRVKFFKSGWNVFDFIIVAVAILPAAGPFSIFRALRIIRTLRLLKSLPKLRLIIESLLHSIPSIGWIAVLLFIVYYIFAVVGTNLFGTQYPEYFGDLGKTFFTLFQVMTLESWASAVARPIMDGAPGAAIFFVSFILIATYTTLNIFIAIVVNTMNEISLKELQEEEQHIKDFVKQENAKLHSKLDDLKRELKKKEVD